MHSILTSRMIVRLRSYGHHTIRGKEFTTDSAFAATVKTLEFQRALGDIRNITTEEDGGEEDQNSDGSISSS